MALVALILSLLALAGVAGAYRKLRNDIAVLQESVEALDSRVNTVEQYKEEVKQFYRTYYSDASVRRAGSNGAAGRPSGWA